MGNLLGSIVFSVFILVIFLIVGRNLCIAIKHLFERHYGIKDTLNRIDLPFFVFFIFLGFLFVFKISGIYRFPLNEIILSLTYIFGLYLVLTFIDCLMHLHLNHLIEKNKFQHRAKSMQFQHKALYFVFSFVFLLFVLKAWSIDLVPFFSGLMLVINSNKITEGVFVLVVYLAIAKTVLYICKTYITDLVKRTKTKIDDMLVVKLEYPISWLIVLYGFKIMFKVMGLEDTLLIPLVVTLMVFFVAHMLIKIVDIVIDNWNKMIVKRAHQHFDDDFLVLMHNLLKIIVVLVAFVIILGVWGIEVKTLLISLGVLGIVLGFALKDTLGNIIGGVSLMMDRSFRVGDVIKVSDKIMGEVESIGLRSTRIKTFSDELVLLPNGELANMQIINYAKPNQALRIEIPVSVAYGSNVEKTRNVLEKCAKKLKYRLKDMPVKVLFMEMGDFALKFEVKVFIEDYKDKFVARNELVTSIYKELKKAKITIPFPTRTLYMKKG